MHARAACIYNKRQEDWKQNRMPTRVKGNLFLLQVIAIKCNALFCRVAPVQVTYASNMYNKYKYKISTICTVQDICTIFAQYVQDICTTCNERQEDRKHKGMPHGVKGNLFMLQAIAIKCILRSCTTYLQREESRLKAEEDATRGEGNKFNFTAIKCIACTCTHHLQQGARGKHKRPLPAPSYVHDSNLMHSFTNHTVVQSSKPNQRSCS